MKIAYLFQKDSHFKAVYATALRLSKQYECESYFVGVEASYIPKSVVNLDFTRKNSLDSLSQYDYVIACLGGYLLNFVVQALLKSQTKVISIFPGIVSHYQLDAFISRMNVDQVWLNSKADLLLYQKICKFFNCSCNGILYGMSWINEGLLVESSLSKYNKKKKAIFFEQTELLKTDAEREKLARMLKKIFISNPEVVFKYKIRDNSNDIFFINLRKELAKCRNVEIVEKIENKDISSSSYFLSISSSALVEGIIYNKQSLIIDRNLLDLDSKEFYKKSNLFLSGFYLEDANNIINNEWMEARVSKPIMNVNLKGFNKINRFLKVKRRKLEYIRVMILYLSFAFPSLIKIINNKHKLLSIKKSLEYLSVDYYD